MLIDKLHALATRLGLSPQVFDPLVLAVLVALTSWVKTGAFDSTEIVIAATGVVWAIVGYVAPVLPKVDYTEAKAEFGEVSRRRAAHKRRR